MASYEDYLTILREFNFTNLPDNDPSDNLNYPLTKEADSNYYITYQTPANPTILLSTGIRGTHT